MLTTVATEEDIVDGVADVAVVAIVDEDIAEMDSHKPHAEHFEAINGQ